MGVLKVVYSTRLYNLKTAFQIPNLIFICGCHRDNNNNEKKGKNDDLLEEPTTCCMSGCANCVWVEYAEKLSNMYKDGGEEAIKRVNEKVSDPNMKAFILHEIRMRKPK